MKYDFTWQMEKNTRLVTVQQTTIVPPTAAELESFVYPAPEPFIDLPFIGERDRRLTRLEVLDRLMDHIASKKYFRFQDITIADPPIGKEDVEFAESYFHYPTPAIAFIPVELRLQEFYQGSGKVMDLKRDSRFTAAMLAGGTDVDDDFQRIVFMVTEHLDNNPFKKPAGVKINAARRNLKAGIDAV